MARVHTYGFHREVALAVTGTGGETVYLSPGNARQLARTLRQLADLAEGKRPEASGADIACRKHGEPIRGG